MNKIIDIAEVKPLTRLSTHVIYYLGLKGWFLLVTQIDNYSIGNKVVLHNFIKEY
jgi:hypothetical protein